MQRILMLLFSGMLCLFGKGYGQELKPKPMVVVIDPGHGGTDPGAIGVRSIKEKDITLRIALEVIRLNKKSDNKNVEIYLTRYKDTLISLGDRARLAGALQANLFLSIHCNWSPNPNAHGAEAFIAYPKTKENIRKSIALALDLVMTLEKQYNRKNRGVKFANFQVLRESILFCPSVLLEVGFISNPEEAMFIMDNANSSTILNLIKQKR